MLMRMSLSYKINWHNLDYFAIIQVVQPVQSGQTIQEQNWFKWLSKKNYCHVLTLSKTLVICCFAEDCEEMHQNV